MNYAARNSGLRSTLTMKHITIWTCVKYVVENSRLRRTLHTNLFTGLDMFEVCSEKMRKAVDCVALGHKPYHRFGHV